MAIVISNNKQINFNNETVSFSDFKKHYTSYLLKITNQSIFRASTLVQKEDENLDSYLARIFYLLYYKKGFGIHNNAETTVNTTRTSRQIASAESINHTILNALGIDIVRKNTKSSSILFKNSGKSAKIDNDELELLIENIKHNRTNIRKSDTRIAFGVELEFIAKPGYCNYQEALSNFNKAMYKLVGTNRYCTPMCYHHNDGNQWELGKDGSLNEENGFAHELTSPILYLDSKKDMNELKTVISYVKDILKGEVNKSCGTHIHMSFACPANEATMKFFVKSYSMNEINLFDRCVSKTRNRSRWCKPVNERVLSDRYRKLNMTKVKPNTNSMHLEFRQLEGTLDFDRIIAWTKLQKLFVESVMSTINKVNVNLEEAHPVRMSMEDVLCHGNLETSTVEELMKLSKIAA